jgi:hypothetical protein
MNPYRFYRVIALLLAASVLPSMGQEVKVPADRGYIQADRYHSVFFGFDYKLPAGWKSSTVAEGTDEKATPGEKPAASPESFLLEASDPATKANLRITAIDLLFTPQVDSAEMFLNLVQEEVKKSVTGVEKIGQVKQEVSGRTFLTRTLKTTVAETAVYQVVSIAIEKNYALMFVISAADPEITKKFDLTQSLTFSAAPTPAAKQATAPDAAMVKPEDGDITDNKYANPYFGFALPFPADWIVHGKEAAARITNTVEKSATGDNAEAVQESLQRTRFLFVALPKAGGAAIMAFSEDLQMAAIDKPQDYLEAMLKGALGPEAKWLKAPEEVTLGGKKFMRASYLQVVQGATVNHTTYVTMERKHALGFDVMYATPEQAESGGKVLQAVSFIVREKPAK